MTHDKLWDLCNKSFDVILISIGFAFGYFARFINRKL